MVDLNDNELDALVSEIDSDLNIRDVPIYRRAIKAVVEFQRRTGIIEPMFGELPYPGAPETHAQRISRWYDEHYGSRQKVDLSPGATILIIRGEPWKCVFPRVYGHVQVDLRRQIQDLPSKLAESLTPEEIKQLVTLFRLRLELSRRMEDSRLKYLAEAREDLVYGVTDVCKVPPNLPMAKLFFSHAAEKSLKGFIDWKGGRIAKHHRLIDHTQQAEDLGLPEVPRVVIDALFCPGSAKYGEYEVRQDEAIAAHDASWGLIAHVLSATPEETA